MRYEQSKPAPRRKRAGGIGGAVINPTVAVTGPVPRPPAAKPHRSLQAVGYQGGIQDFNNRLQQAVDAHRAVKGFDPAPGLALDVARSKVPTEAINPSLFGAVGSRLGAMARGALVGVDRDPGARIISQLEQAAKDGTYDKVWADNAKQIWQLAQDDPEFQNKVLGLNARAAKIGGASVPPMGTFTRILQTAVTGVGQVTAGLVVGPPTFAYEEGRATYHDVGAAVHLHTPKHLARTNAKLAKGVVKGVQRDIHNPEDNPGYLFLDIFGLASAGAGLGTRVGRAGEAVARGEGKAAAKNLVQRPRGGRIEMRKGEATEERLGSENMMVNAVQRLKQSSANKRMELRSEGYPAGALSIVRPAAARDWLEAKFEPLRIKFGDEAKFRRERAARLRVQTNLALSLKADIEAVSGWSERTTMALGRLPQKMRRGLSVGEQKALQVLTLDDPDPLNAWRSFHERMIAQEYGDVSAHRAHLAALKLAEEALAKPSKRFKKAATLVYEAIAEMEHLKYEKAGLTPDIGERRVIAAGEVVRSGEKVGTTPLPGERLSEHSLYIPFFSRAHSPRRGADTGRYPQVRDSGYGIGPPQGLSEMRHEFTGEVIRFGNFRWDTTNLVAESYGATVGFAARLDVHSSIWKASTETKRGPFDRRVRDLKDIPDELKEVARKADEGLLTDKDAAALKPKELEKLYEFLYPEEDVPGVRWFDQALLEVDHAPIASVAKAVAQAANETVRVPILFLRPAYALNAVGNTGMAVLQQGHHFPPNMLRSLYATDLYGERIARKLDALAGQSKSKSYVNERNLFGINAVGRVLAQKWSRYTDDFFRRSAIIHELNRLGYDLPLRKLTREERANMERILSSRATEREAADVVEAGRRGNKAMVEFDNQAWVEREILKQVIFVYPWVSRSLVWSVRSVIEHPVKADILAQIGADEQEQHPELSKNVPEWFKKGGYIPVGVDKNGDPVVINPTSVNTWSTLSQMLQTAQAGFIDGAPGTEFDSAFGLLGPVAKFLVKGLSGRDDYGNAYPGSDWFGAAKDVLDDLPQVAAVRRSQKENPELSPVDLAKRKSLLSHYKSALHRTVFSPGWADGFGMLVTAGLTPRSADKAALQARYWEELSPEKRHALERRFLRDALHEQADYLLKRKVPDQVREAVDLGSEMTWRAAQRSKELGRTVPIGTLERTLLDIDTLAANHRIPAADAAELKKKARKAQTKEDQRRFHSALLDKYAGGKQLQEWDDSVRFVASFTKENLQARLHALGSLSELKRVTADKETLYAAGRQALVYRDKIKQLRVEAEALPQAERDVKLAELRQYVDEQDKSIKVDGKVVAPSPVRLDWAQMSEKDRQDTMRSLSRRAWGSMANFEKELIGKKVPPKVSAAWAIIAQAKAEYRRDNYGAPISVDQVYGLAKQLEKAGYKGIVQDFLFSQQRKIRRLEVLKPYANLEPKIRAQFDRVIGNYAKQVASALQSGDYDNSEVKGAWVAYIRDSITPWLAQPGQEGLRAWLEPFGPDFLNGLVDR